MIKVFLLLGILVDPYSGEPSTTVLGKFDSYEDCDTVKEVYDYGLYYDKAHENKAVVCVSVNLETI